MTSTEFWNRVKTEKKELIAAYPDGWVYVRTVPHLRCRTVGGRPVIAGKVAKLPIREAAMGIVNGAYELTH